MRWIWTNRGLRQGIVWLCALAAVLGPIATPMRALADEADELLNSPWQEPSIPSVRLNFFLKPWNDVLTEVAQQSGSALVMQQAPAGRFTRRDSQRYSRAEAVRILNRELEPMGARILEKGRHLVVVSVKDTQTRYRGPQLAVSPGAAPPPPQTAQAPPPSWTRETHTITGPPAYKAQQRTNVAAPVHPIEQLAQLPEPSPVAAASGTRAELVTTRVRTRHRAAADVARSIYEPVKENARLTPAEPGWPPAFEVYAKAPQGALGAAPRDYKIGIDVANNDLLIESSADRVRQLESLVHKLDLPNGVAEQQRFVPHAGDVTRIASKLQPVLNALTAQQPGEQQPAQEEQPQQPADQFPPQNGEQQPPAGEEPLRLDLRGSVSVQDVPGVGLVVTGNREDVEAVLRVIRTLETAGAAIVPDMHLLNLQHVSSEVLAEFLTTVYDNLNQTRTSAVTAPVNMVRIFAVGKPNAILILAPGRELQSILELAQQLDQPVDPTVAFEIFRLRHAVAAQVVANIETFYAERPGIGPRIRAFADVRTNSVIVQAAPRDLDEVARLIAKLDAGQSAAVNQIRIFTLQNATAAELEQVLNSAIQSVVNPPQAPGAAGGALGGIGIPGGAAGQGAEQLRDARSAVLEFLATDGEAQRLVRSGILADIRVTADTARNAIIVSAPEASMELMEALIEQLDTPTSLVAEIKVFNLRNADATATVTLLEALFESDADAEQPGIQLAGAEGAGAGLIPMRFAVDVRTNSITAVGSADALQIVEAIILRLDESEVRQRQNTVVKLKNSPATEVALAINEFRTAQRDLAQIDPDLVTSLEMLEREIVVVPEPVSNSLLISATPRYYNELLTLVAELDQKPPEVVIQALLVEVELDNVDEFGVELGFQDSVLFDRSINNTPGFNFNNQPLGNNPANPSEIGEQILTDVGLARTNPALGFGGLVLSASSEAVSVLIRALSAKRNVQVLSRPTIRTLDNQLAQIHVGQQVPIVTGVSTTGGVTGLASPQITQQDVGIILAVTPRISPDGSIVIETVAINSALADEGVPIFTDATSGNVIESPIINVTTAQATVSVPNGQTVVLGGMITKSDSSFENKVPWLGDVPVLGHAFRFDSNTSRRTELLIFLTPRVIRHEADSELIKRVEAERLHFVERDAEDLHGPLYSAPPPEALGPMYPPGILPGGDPNCPPIYPDGAGVPTMIMQPGDYLVEPIPQGRIESSSPGPMMVQPTPAPPAPPAPGLAPPAELGPQN